jgi:hypothetical protein
MKRIILILLMFKGCVAFGQNDSNFIRFSTEHYKSGFAFCAGVLWTSNAKQDSIINIFIEGDTMTAVRNLLVYCMQEKSENDNARILLSMINLDHIKTLFKSNDFIFYLKEYRKAIKENIKERAINYPYFPYKP